MHPKTTKKWPKYLYRGLFFTALVFFLFEIAPAEVFYLDNSAAGANNGGEGRDAWQSLSAALTALNNRPDKGAGHTVIVKEGNGSYGDFTDASSRTNYLTFTAAEGQTPTFSSITLGINGTITNSRLRFEGIRIYRPGLMGANQDAVKLHMVRYVELKGLDIVADDFVFDNTSDGIHMFRCSDIVIQKCTFRSLKTRAFDRAICAVKPSDNISIDHCDVSQCKFAVVAWGQNWKITNNHFHHLFSDGIIGACIANSIIENNDIHEIEAPVFLEYHQASIYNPSAQTITAAAGAPFSEVQTQDWCRITVDNLTSEWVMVSSAADSTLTLNKPFDTSFNKGTITKVECKKKYHCDGFQMWKGWDGDPTDEYTDDFKLENIIIRNNKIYDIRGQAYTQCVLWNDFGIHQTCSNITFENNLLYNAEGGYEFYLQYTDGIVLRNNTIIGVLYCNPNVTITKMHNNIIQNFGTGTNVSILKESHNIVQTWQNGTPSVQTLVLNSEKDFFALFADPSRNNYIIQEKTWADDRGNPEEATESDIRGMKRSASTPDIGAYEINNESPQSPVALAGSDQILWITDTNNLGEILLDGTSSYDPDGYLVAYLWTDENGTVLGTESICPTLLPLGSHTISLMVTDNQGLSSTDSFLVSVQLLSLKQHTDGLTGLWRLDDYGQTTTADASGNGYTAALIAEPQWGRSWADEDFLFFTKQNQAIQIPSDAITPQVGTITLWAAPSAESGFYYLFGHVCNESNRIALLTNNGNLAVSLGDSPLLQQNIAALPVGQLSHLALTWDSGQYAIYIDGEQRAAGTYTGLNELSSTFDIGNYGNPVLRTVGFLGWIDEIRTYNRALAGEEIRNLYQSYNVKENRRLAFQVQAADSNGKPISYQAASLPAGAAFDRKSQSFSWRPWYQQAGEYQILFDADGQPSQTVTVTVQEVQLQDWYKVFLEAAGKL